MARFARDLLRLMGAVIAEHFSEKTIAMISGYAELEPSFAPNGATGAGPAGCARRECAAGDARREPGTGAAICGGRGVMRQDRARLPHRHRGGLDDCAGRAGRKTGSGEVLQQMVPLLEQVVPIAMGNPALASVSREITLFAARGFRVARTLEETLEQAFDAVRACRRPRLVGLRQASRVLSMSRSAHTRSTPRRRSSAIRTLSPPPKHSGITSSSRRSLRRKALPSGTARHGGGAA